MENFDQFNESIPKYSIQSIGEPFNRLSSVFNKVTNSYKYYWLWAILELIRDSKNLELSYSELSLKMLDLVWYPLSYFKLSFGKQDGFEKIAKTINNKVDFISCEASAPPVSKQLKDKTEIRLIISEINTLVRYVPFRFLTPFFSAELRGLRDGVKNKKIEELVVKNSDINIPYSFYDKGVIINPNWANFFRSYYKLLLDFIHRNLIEFLNKHNPNTIGISSKLIKPEKRNLTKQRNLLNEYLQHHREYRCLYTNVPLKSAESIDHFIPWSYVVHDHIWNLVPVTKSANSSKSNLLPKFELYFNTFVSFQYQLANFVFRNRKRGEFFEAYSSILKQDSICSFEDFSNVFKDIFEPLRINAYNLGFQPYWSNEA